MNKGLGKFFTKKILKLITLLVALCIITFALMELSPIDPVTAYVGASTKVSAEQRALIAEHWGLNQPALVRFWSWFKSIISGDWGTSMIYKTCFRSNRTKILIIYMAYGNFMDTFRSYRFCFRNYIRCKRRKIDR